MKITLFADGLPDGITPFRLGMEIDNAELAPDGVSCDRAVRSLNSAAGHLFRALDNYLFRAHRRTSVHAALEKAAYQELLALLNGGTESTED
jgi:hypothetical protein